jgi:hypothetical protein
MRNITFEEFAEIMNNSAAVILDNNALSYPYVESYEDEDGNTGYDRVEINYMSDYAQIENSFYSDDTNVTILDDGSMKVKSNDEFYNIHVLEFKKLS